MRRLLLPTGMHHIYTTHAVSLVGGGGGGARGRLGSWRGGGQEGGWGAGEVCGGGGSYLVCSIHHAAVEQ